MELPLFRGFFSGEKYNYMVFGQENKEEDDNKDVIRIVKYTKAWDKIGSDNLKGANTIIPFEAGSLRMCEDNNVLFIRTCHEMYTSSDGYNHQANLTISYDEETDKIIDSFSGVANINWCGYMSHSFNQFTQIDNGQLVTADHGDAYPRAIALVKYTDLHEGKGFTNGCENVSIVSFDGNIGDNFTGASLGGFQLSSTHYLVAYNNLDKVDFNKGEQGVRNIYVGTVDRNDFSSNSLQNIKITSLPTNGKQSVTTPFLIKIADNDFLLMWKTFDLNYTHTIDCQKGISKTQYVRIDGKGQRKGAIMSVDTTLSDCTPIVYGNTVRWYATNNSSPVFYTLNLSTNTTNSTYNKKTALPKKLTTNIVPPKNSTKLVGSLKYRVTKSSKKNGTVMITKAKSKKVRSITIPKYIKWNGYTFKVTCIGKKAFYGCSKLKKLLIKSTYLSCIGSSAIKKTNKKLVIQVPKRQYRKYKKLFSKRTGYTKKIKMKKK